MKLHTAFLATAIALSLAACKPNEDKKPESTSAPAATQQSANPSGETQATSPSTSQGATTAPATGNTQPQQPAGETSSTTSSSTDAGTAGAAAGTTSAAINTGTKECDEFLAAVSQCITSKVPEEERNSKLKQINDMASQWKNVPESSRAATCTTAREAVRESYANFGCEI